MIDSVSPIDPALLDVFPIEHDGYPAELALGDTGDVLRDVCGSASREFPQALWIEPSNWPDKARENDLHKTWPLNYVDRFTHQGSSHECTSHSLRAILEGCRNRQRGVSYPDGPKKGFRYEESAQFGSVWLAPNSVYAEANPRQRGGAGIRQVLEIAVRRGMLPSLTQPRDYGFKHATHDTAGGTNSSNQSTGRWVPISQLPAGWQETAAWFKPLEVIFPSSWEQAVCLVLHGYLVGVGRSGHAIPWGQWNIAQQAMAYCDSYDVIRYDSLATVKRAWSGSFAVASMTTPSDWSKPAGGD